MQVAKEVRNTRFISDSLFQPLIVRPAMVIVQVEEFQKLCKGSYRNSSIFDV